MNIKTDWICYDSLLNTRMDLAQYIIVHVLMFQLLYMFHDRKAHDK